MKAFASKAGSTEGGGSEPFGGGRKKCVASDRDKKTFASVNIWLHRADSGCGCRWFG